MRNLILGLAALLAVGLGNAVSGALIHYDASVTPDAVTNLSANRRSSAPWSASNGELTMTTNSWDRINFGNHPIDQVL